MNHPFLDNSNKIVEVFNSSFFRQHFNKGSDFIEISATPPLKLRLCHPVRVPTKSFLIPFQQLKTRNQFKSKLNPTVASMAYLKETISKINSISTDLTHFQSLKESVQQ